MAWLRRHLDRLRPYRPTPEGDDPMVAARQTRTVLRAQTHLLWRQAERLRRPMTPAQRAAALRQICACDPISARYRGRGEE